MKLSTLLSAIDGKIDLCTDPEISLVTPDPERCIKESLFICIKGFSRDGHDKIDLALKNGACAAVLSCDRTDVAHRLSALGIPFVSVNDTRDAQSRLIARFNGDPQDALSITAVTGTNGKTTVVSLLEAIYSTAGYNCRALGTLTGKLTTPDPEELYPTLKSLRDQGVTHVFMEASSHALSLNKLSAITFSNAIFTNLSEEHLDFHKSMEEYANAKARLFTRTKRSIVNVDDKFSPLILQHAVTPYTCSALRTDTDVSARNIRLLKEKGVRYDMFIKSAAIKIESPMPGDFSVMNTLQAATCGYLDGISQRIIRQAIKNLSRVKGRIERVHLPTNEFSVYIDFAHTPDALIKLLSTVRSFMTREQRLVLVFGCGGDRDKHKRPIMGGIASSYADFVIITSDNSRSERTEDIISDILSGFDYECPHTVIEDRAAAIGFAVSHALTNDVIVLAGKGHEQYQILSDGTHPFDESAIVLSSIKDNMKNRGQF